MGLCERCADGEGDDYIVGVLGGAVFVLAAASWGCVQGGIHGGQSAGRGRDLRNNGLETFCHFGGRI